MNRPHQAFDRRAACDDTRIAACLALTLLCTADETDMVMLTPYTYLYLPVHGTWYSIFVLLALACEW